MNFKKFGALALAGAMTLTCLGGCGQKIDNDAVVATFGEQEIKLGIANFFARYQQACYDDLFGSTSSVTEDGAGIWNQDLYGTGETMEDTIKGSTLDLLHEYYTLEAHMDEYQVSLSAEDEAKIKKAAEAFMNNNSKEALKELGATEELVAEVLRLFTISKLMNDAMIADVDTVVSDEEANMRAYSLITVPLVTYVDPETGETKEFTEAEKSQMTLNALEFAAKAKGCEDLAAFGEEYSYTATSGTYDASNTTLDAELKAAMDAVNEGEVDSVVTDSNVFIFRIDKNYDEEATENNRKRIVNIRQSNRYKEILEGWQENDGWTVNEDVWGRVSFDDYFTTVKPEAETE